MKERPKTRLTVVVGAGASIRGGAPSVGDLTSAVLAMDSPRVIGDFRDYIIREGASDQLSWPQNRPSEPAIAQIDRGLRSIRNDHNFEDLLHAVESLEPYVAARTLQSTLIAVRPVLTAFTDPSTRYEGVMSWSLLWRPTLPKTKVLELFTPTFIEQRRNAVFIGTTGVGKTHLACALGVWACTNGFRTAFTTAADLLMSLISAKRADRLKQRLTAIERYDLVIIDELGYLPFEREATDLLFQVIAGRYERGSVAITTNLAFPDWGHVFPDAMAASAVVDRIVHHAAVFELSGQSYRLRSRAKASAKKNDN